ncbi:MULTISPECIES: type II toxin-antitoxin system RelE/ParE family toxin [Acidiphilium]|uniref:Type II toxin-antitoxin system RelE/ParE family toxin n=1 Tax=Acidiphilium iwatense TaxID=768198 RepID=A0ABS9E0J0_9PROT|nr:MULTISPECIES: type II toxin-antitoxin system RelE/ParE family toxin [Acidiphilium]MCF3948533.1 type II toxin-antitoxin system RelE/ParE family toxin [Acidiphilium iwatense]
MKTCTIVFTPEAQSQLAALHHHLATNATPDMAARYTEALITRCESLATLPRRAIARDDIRPGLRIMNYRKRTVIAFSIEADRVAIIGVFHGGQDYEAALEQDEGE